MARSTITGWPGALQPMSQHLRAWRVRVIGRLGSLAREQRLAESLDRLNQAVRDAQPADASPAAALRAKALGWFRFYAANPWKLDLGLYLVHGLAPRGLASELKRLNARLHAALAPGEAALQAMGLDAASGQRENTGLFAHGVGLLLLLHTGRIRTFRQDATELFDHYLAALLLRAAIPTGERPDAAGPR